jgi:zinc and cadmium transporter
MHEPNLELFFWILGSGLLMSCISFLGAVTFIIPERVVQSMLLPLVSLAAGSLLGSALFYLLPESVEVMGNGMNVYLYVLAGFLTFFILEQFLHWHHYHGTEDELHQHHHHQHKPVTYLVLISHGIHNFVDGIVVGGSFLVDIRIGIFAWIGVALHEIPQKLGDYSILLHGGWKQKKALIYNFLCSLSFLAGSLLIFFLAKEIEVHFLIPFAAGMFLYVAAVDLVPEIKNHHNVKKNAIHFISFVIGVAIILTFRLLLDDHGHGHHH